MNTGKAVLAQILTGLSGEGFRFAQSTIRPRATPRHLPARDHFAAMVFAQLTYRESLRDIEVCQNNRRA